LRNLPIVKHRGAEKVRRSPHSPFAVLYGPRKRKPLYFPQALF